MSLERLSELLFENSETIPNGLYLNLMNELRDLHKVKAKPVAPVAPPRPLITNEFDILNALPSWEDWKKVIWEDDIVDDEYATEGLWTTNVYYNAKWEIFNPAYPTCRTIWEVEQVNRKSVRVRESILRLEKIPIPTENPINTTYAYRVVKVKEERGKIIYFPKVKSTIFNSNRRIPATTYTHTIPALNATLTKDQILFYGWNPLNAVEPEE